MNAQREREARPGRAARRCYQPLAAADPGVADVAVVRTGRDLRPGDEHVGRVAGAEDVALRRPAGVVGREVGVDRPAAGAVCRCEVEA